MGSVFTKQRQTVGLAAWFLLCFLVSAIGAFASIQAKEFYGALEQPSWAPPAWLFGPVWTVLFTMMAISAWLVWREGGFSVQRKPLALFIVQLVFNALWSWLFFAWHMGAASFFEIVLLWFLILATIIVFIRVHTIAAFMLVPYFLWVSFAAMLNYSLWQLNSNTLL